MKIHTPRLELCDFTTDDVDAFHRWHTDERYLAHHPEGGMSHADTAALVDQFVAWQTDQPRWRWQLAFVRRDSGRLIGCGGIRREAVDDPSANIGYELDPEHWGQGFGTEAMSQLLHFAFAELELSEVTARIVDGNDPSIRLAHRLGLRHAYDLPPGPGKDGRMWPARAEYRLLRGDWQASDISHHE